MSMRTLKRSIIRSQSKNTADFRDKWQKYHSKDMEQRKAVDTNRKPTYHYDNGKHLIATWKRMKEYVAQLREKQSENNETSKTVE